MLSKRFLVFKKSVEKKKRGNLVFTASSQGSPQLVGTWGLRCRFGFAELVRAQIRAECAMRHSHTVRGCGGPEATLFPLRQPGSLSWPPHSPLSPVYPLTAPFHPTSPHPRLNLRSYPLAQHARVWAFAPRSPGPSGKPRARRGHPAGFSRLAA